MRYLLIKVCKLDNNFKLQTQLACVAGGIVTSVCFNLTHLDECCALLPPGIHPSWEVSCLVPRRLSFDENVRAKEGGKETTGETPGRSCFQDGGKSNGGPICNF